MLVKLLLPIVLSSVALFFASFLSWMVLQLHRKDWRKLGREDDFLRAVREIGLAPGNYMFPGCDSPEEMKSDAYQQRFQAGPRGVMTVFSGVNMGRNLALTFVYFLVVNFCIAYLAEMALTPGAEPMLVFRFVSTAALVAYLPAIVAHSIWFRCRIVGHVIESIAYALIVGAIFAAMWPTT